MKFKSLFITSLLVLTGCSVSKGNSNQNTSKKDKDFGVFLGAKKEDKVKLTGYQNLVIELDEFDSGDVAELKRNNDEIYAYLSVGSLENYRSYYDEFKDLTFMDYENWPNERWIDVSNISWQNHLISEATRLKTNGADGLFMDNFDVYYIVMEEYDCSSSFKEAIYNGCHKILEEFSKLDLKLIINSGTDFLERMHDENDNLIRKIDVYCQECVFSSIEDYENDVFGVQNSEDKSYYLDIINFMKANSRILLLEYTTDAALIEQIKSFCSSNQYHYYISNTVNLS